MVINLLQPAMLWGLLGLLVPIAIHLLHKRSQKVVMVGSLQPYRGGKPVQARSLRLNELGLLLLRCLLLVLFVFLLAQPVFIRQDTVEKKYLFIAPELMGSLQADSLRAAGFEAALLQPGLPLLQEGVPADTSRYSYWDVFQEIESLANAGDTAWLYFNPHLDRFMGRRPQLNTIFQPLPVTAGVGSDRKFAQLLQQPGDQLLLRWWEKDAQHWLLRQRSIANKDAAKALQDFAVSADVQAQDTLQVGIWASGAMEKEVRQWRRALQLIDSLLPASVISTKIHEATTAAKADSFDVKVWLSEAEPPAPLMQKDGGIRLVLQNEKSQRWFVADRDDQALYYIRMMLTEQQNNRQQLANFLPALQQLLPRKAEDLHPPLLLAETQWQPVHITEKKILPQTKGASLEQWIFISLLIVLIIERWLSLRK